MNQQKKAKINVQNWEEELKSNGVIHNEDALLTEIKSLDEKEEAKQISVLLTIAALSRARHTDQMSSLVTGWMKKALSLDPKNLRAAQFLAQSEWAFKQDLLNKLRFPPLRETDNRAAKKKSAEQTIETARSFLQQAEDDLDDLQMSSKSSMEYKKGELLHFYNQLIPVLTQAIGETELLLKAAEDYDRSISGVFYTSTYYEEMKTHIERLNDLKQEWNEVFTSFLNRPEEGYNPLDELQQMVGMESVKNRVHHFYQFLKYQTERKALGFQIKDELSLNMIFTGNPGTGKTTVARFLAEIYHHLGVLPRQEVVETNRSQLVGAYVGQTEENVRGFVEKALGGVLFIDEAYTLKRNSQSKDDYGQTVIDTLVSLMTSEEYGGEFAVVLAGYPEEMRQFLDANPGLRSRFPHSNHIALPDYSEPELIAIAEKIAMENDYVITEPAKIELKKRIENERVDETFGNARTVKDLVLGAIFKKGAYLQDDQDILSYTLLEKEDFAVEEDLIKDEPEVQLNQMVGLEAVKEEVKTLVSFVKVQQMRREQGIPPIPIQLHSVFSGNPGTGKTTVAKIFASLLRECGLLKRGHLIVASRADFVAGYIGQTAIKTKKMIRQALGGVLFIDEAYSLFSEATSDYGKEVIDTLVDEMTKQNENLVVILAGYPNEMEQLLRSNPGLKSRFKKFFHFEDYSSDQLIEILENYIANYQFKLDDSAKGYLQNTLKHEATNGNGRYAKNLADHVIQVQARRLLNENLLDVENMSLLKKEDFIAAMKIESEGE
ncbi:AAA family ATPase [Cytobacillus purgationiresistens]|uniref:SpoVK/Ycf46/Vps4 family AAA+-type ATPase n=1 Tax=Cytobacillus purgationiresistens TaxID=863449 RepID=A0ABU0ABI8_9BACI|nr:AAA family ATPase [Cytobacillus purgationiresistens]MDQ0268616.1 SpoVK/Ycf46/Vps4 family AAA+-type ATPase [Cytobacillus purgationiresistens]